MFVLRWRTWQGFSYSWLLWRSWSRVRRWSGSGGRHQVLQFFYHSAQNEVLVEVLFYFCLFVCLLFVCLFVCLSVYLLAGFRKNYWTKLDQILTEYCPKYRIEPINFSEVKVKYQGHRGVKRFWDENGEKWSDFHDFFFKWELLKIGF